MNSLYGGGMSEELPTGDFKWEDPNTFNWRDPPDGRGCIIEADLSYIDPIKTYKFPLGPEKANITEEHLSDYQKHILEVENKKVGKLPKLLLHLYGKEKYVVYYKLLKYYESMGLVPHKIHAIISFKQSAWLKTIYCF